MKTDLTRSELFKSFAEIEVNDIHVDLHNDFKCIAISFSEKEKKMAFKFKAERGHQNKIQQVDIIFNNASISILKFDMSDEDEGYWTIDNMYRGRFSITEKDLTETAEDGRNYYYIDFYDSYSFEVLAENVVAELNG
jgi:hypothetical protein